MRSGAEVEVEEEEELEYVLLDQPEVFVYKIPPRPPHGGHRAETWGQQCIWRGRLRVTAKGNQSCVKLLDAENGSLFALCPVPKDPEAAVERTADSSRYFVLRLVDGQTHAFVGLGFEDRGDAFDFNCCLQDFARRQVEGEAAAGQTAEKKTRDLKMKDGQRVHLNIRCLPTHSSNTEEIPTEPLGTFGIPPPPPPPPGRRRTPQRVSTPTTESGGGG